MKGNRTKTSRKKKPREYWKKNTCMQRGHPETETYINVEDKNRILVYCKICKRAIANIHLLDNMDKFQRECKIELAKGEEK